jgi:hypothetical protein
MIHVSKTLVAAAVFAVLSFGASAAPAVQEANPGYQHMAQAVVTSKTVVRNGYRKRVIVKKKYVAPRPAYRSTVIVKRPYVPHYRSSRCVTRVVVRGGVKRSTRVCH